MMKALDFLLYPIAWLSTSECEAMDIKQRLAQAIESKEHEIYNPAFMEKLCVDALAEIERLERAFSRVEDDSRDRSAQLHTLKAQVNQWAERMRREHPGGEF